MGDKGKLVVSQELPPCLLHVAVHFENKNAPVLGRAVCQGRQGMALGASCGEKTLRRFRHGRSGQPSRGRGNGTGGTMMLGEHHQKDKMFHE